MELDEETLNKILGEIIHKAAETVKVELQLRGLDQLLAVTMDIEFTPAQAVIDADYTVEDTQDGN